MGDKEKLSVSDFPVAPRRQKKTDAATPATIRSATTNQHNARSNDTGNDQPPRNGLHKPSDEALQSEIQNRALAQEDSRNRLKQLGRNRQRESKHYVNAPLDYQLKKRLERAAHENDLKMTVIIKDALDQYLKDNGY